MKEDLRDTVKTFSSDDKNINKKLLNAMYEYGISFDDYFLYKFDSLNNEQRSSYLTTFNRIYYYTLLNDLRYSSLLDNKYETYLHYKKYFKRDLIIINPDQNNYNEFESFVKKNPQFMWKPLSESSGKGIKIYKKKEFTSVVELYSMLKNKNGIVEELIVQSDDLGKLHPNSVNTIRIPQVITSTGDVEIFYPVLRVGQTNNVVDNAGQGGIFACINAKTGVISSDGYDYFGNSYTFHPTTNIEFRDYIIPKWNEAVELVKEIAEIIPEARYIGWDFALTNDGWVVVEGNQQGDFKLLQIAYRRGLKEDLIELI